LISATSCIGHFLESSNAWGIKDYCNNIYSPTETTSANEQSHNVYTTEFSNDQEETGNDELDTKIYS